MVYPSSKIQVADGIYFRKIIRYDVDTVLSYARTLDQFKEGLEEIGYQVDLSGKHWTLKHPQSKRTFRFYKLTRDNHYDEEHLVERINNNYLFPMQPVADIIPCKEYQGDHKKLRGIKALYFKYCYTLGIIRPKGSKQHYPSPQLRKDLIYRFPLRVQLDFFLFRFYQSFQFRIQFRNFSVDLRIRLTLFFN